MEYLFLTGIFPIPTNFAGHMRFGEILAKKKTPGDTSSAKKNGLKYRKSDRFLRMMSRDSLKQKI